MSGVRNRVDAFIQWASDYFGKGRGPQVLDRSQAPRIDWDDDPGTDAEPATADGPTPAVPTTA
jgi:NADH dehydrogenase